MSKRDHLLCPGSNCTRLGLMTILLSCCVVSFMSHTAQAQKPQKIKQSQAFPTSADELYANDPWYNLKLSAEQEMGLFLVDPPRRHASEFTQYSNHHLHFHLWRPISESTRAMWSRALGWLIFGRIKYSRGAQQLFSDIPSLKRITLSLHEVQRPRKNKDGVCKSEKLKRRQLKKRKVDTVHTYLTLSITRRDFEHLKIEQLKQCSELLDCDKSVRSMVSLLKLNTRYLKRRKQ